MIDGREEKHEVEKNKPVRLPSLDFVLENSVKFFVDSLSAS